MKRLWLLGLFSLLALAGCPPAGTTTGTDDTTAQDQPPPCPTASESFQRMVPATYAVVVQMKSPEGQGKTIDQFIGTAFAAHPWLLATNAHVVQAIVKNPWPFPVKKVVAVQAGTGHSVELDLALSHRDYTGDPVASPDVAILRTTEELADHLDLASDDEVGLLALGDELALTGFPGDVEQWFDIVVGKSVPQATALSGSVSSLRAFDPSERVTPETVDIIQHQTPATPGTSGSPLVYCDKVVAVHNAGTMRAVVTVGLDGSLSVERQAEAANSFGIHVRYLRQVIAAIYGQYPSVETLPEVLSNFVDDTVIKRRPSRLFLHR